MRHTQTHVERANRKLLCETERVKRERGFSRIPPPSPPSSGSQSGTVTFSWGIVPLAATLKPGCTCSGFSFMSGFTAAFVSHEWVWQMCATSEEQDQHEAAAKCWSTAVTAQFAGPHIISDTTLDNRVRHTFATLLVYEPLKWRKSIWCSSNVTLQHCSKPDSFFFSELAVLIFHRISI